MRSTCRFFVFYRRLLLAGLLLLERLVQLHQSRIQWFSRGAGKAVILLPGGALTIGYRDDLANDLAAAGYRVVGINFRGSGRSAGSSKG
jgi:alpha-beta hydrolase superfamily lysophospholipase